MSLFKFTHKWKPTDDPWDCNAIEYLLQQPVVQSQWKWNHSSLFECLRRQTAWLRDKPERVQLAEELARQCGVTQTTGRVVHFIRHDADAPEYPHNH